MADSHQTDITGIATAEYFPYYNETVEKEHTETVRENIFSQVLSFLQPVLIQKDNQAEFFLRIMHFILSLTWYRLSNRENISMLLLNIPSANFLPRF
ncbi:MAG: hypothetical protein IPH18_18150 [Chitinophagaceae bacterium]|nr:hypothetical protein [Chitinophagaceae bacterium]